MYPTDQQQLDEAHRILEMSPTRDMYADQLAKTIAAQLNAREGSSRFEEPSALSLVATLELDSRFGLRKDRDGVSIVLLR